MTAVYAPATRWSDAPVLTSHGGLSAVTPLQRPALPVRLCRRYPFQEGRKVSLDQRKKLEWAADDEDDCREPTHYDILGIRADASSRAIAKAFMTDHTYLRDEEDVAAVRARRREEAYRVLGDPVLRSGYDQQQGNTRGRLADLIATKSDWGSAWAALLGLLAIALVIGTGNVSRMVGRNFAPDFAEQQVWVPGEICGEDGVGRVTGCVPGRWESEFHSSNGTWRWALNNWLTMGLAPAALIGGVGLGGRRLVNRMAGHGIAWVRDEGYKDTWVRIGIWVLVAAVGLSLWGLFFAYY